MHLEDYHGERSEEDDARYPVLPGLDNFIDDDDDGSFVDLVSMAVTGISVGDQPHCWTTLQATDSDALLSPLDSAIVDTRNYLDWDQMPVIFQYPSEGSSGGSPPGSTCCGSEAVTPTWSGVAATAERDEKTDREKLPSMGSAFSFSRAFCNNTIYSDYGSESQNYQDYQDCQDMVSLLMSVQNDNVAQNNNGSSFVQTSANEFDLSLIRCDPTSLLSAVDSSSPSTVGCFAGNDQQESSFRDFNPPYYAVGHLVSSQHQQSSALSTVSFADEVVGTTNENFGNQVILPRNEGLLLGNRLVVDSKESERNNGDKSHGKCAVLLGSDSLLRSRFVIKYYLYFFFYQSDREKRFLFRLTLILLEKVLALIK